MTGARLPYRPLERVLHLRWDAPAVGRGGKDDHGDHGLWCDRQAAILLGVRRDDIPRYRRHGLTPRMADRLACHISLHPLLIWGAEWTEAAAPLRPLHPAHSTAA